MNPDLANSDEETPAALAPKEVRVLGYARPAPRKSLAEGLLRFAAPLFWFFLIADGFVVFVAGVTMFGDLVFESTSLAESGGKAVILLVCGASLMTIGLRAVRRSTAKRPPQQAEEFTRFPAGEN